MLGLESTSIKRCQLTFVAFVICAGGLKCFTLFQSPSNNGWMHAPTTREAYRIFTEDKTFHYTELSDEDLLLFAYETRDELKEVVVAVKKLYWDKNDYFC